MSFSRNQLACLVLASTTVLITATGDLTAQDWPQWRGPNRDGTTSVDLPDPWPQQLPQLWRVKVGAGHSGPVSSGNRVVSFARQGDEEVVTCLDATSGKQLWRVAYPAPYSPAEPAKPHGKGPFATPAIVGGNVYTFGISGTLSCFNLTSGKQLWQKGFSEQHSPTYPEWGAAASPLVNGQHCIAAVGGKDGGAVVAFDKDTGEPAWELPLKEGPAYASPLIATLAGTPTLLVMARNRLVGVAPDSGDPLWQQKFTTGYEMNIVDPLPAGKMVLLSGFRRGTTAVKLGGKDGPQQLWHNDKVSAYMSSPVRYGEHLYLLSQERNGVLQCLAMADGSVAWTSEDEKIGKYASLVRVDDRLLVLKTDGELLLIAADPAGLKVVGRSQLSESPVWAHLALADLRIFVKDDSHLTAYSLKVATKGDG
jgi:outer membrane protein assembly factor BamB